MCARAARGLLLALALASPRASLAQGFDAPAPAGPVLTLAAALQQARASEPSLRQSQASSRAARARVDQARAPLLPQVSTEAKYQRATANSGATGGVAAGVARTGSSFDTFNHFDFGLNVDQLIFDFGATSKRLDAAEESARAGAEDERVALLAVERDVRVNYFDARAAKALVDVARETLASTEQHLAQIQAFVAAGTRAEIDLAQARTDRANARVDLISAENEYAVAKARLNQAMGAPPSRSDYDVANESLPPVNGEDGASAPLVERAMKARPESAALHKRQRAQELTVRSIQGAYWPSLGAFAGASEGGTALDSMAWNLGAGVSLRWWLFQGGATSAQVDEARADLVRLGAEADLLAQRIRFEVEQARLDVRAAKALHEALDEVVTSARERLRLAEGRYQSGVGSALELSDAQLVLSEALARRVHAEYGLAAARARLLAALGSSG